MCVLNFLSNLSESENVLKYCLYLQLSQNSPNELPTINEPNPDWFNDLSERTFNCCKVLMNGGNPDFWGLSKDNPVQNDLSILSFLHHFNSSWKLMLQHHGVISAFVKLRKLIGSSNQLTAYHALLYTHFLTQNRDHGLDYLIHNDYLNIEAKNNALSINESIKGQKDKGCEFGELSYSEYLRQTTSYYSNSIVSLSKNIPVFSDLGIENFKLSQVKENKRSGKYRIPAHFLEFNNLLRINSTQLRHILSSYKAENGSFTIRKYEDHLRFCKELFSSIDSNELRFSNSDKLYVRYQFEHFFNLNMINCLFQNIKRTGVDLNYDMTAQADLNILSSCLLLPNIFSRQYLVQMAFDILRHNYVYEESFFFTLKNDSDVVVSKLNSAKDILSESNKLFSWRNLYQRFIRYLTRFYFPVYENVFFVSLYNDLQSSYPEKRESELLADLYIILSKYLSQESIYNEILSMDTKIVGFEKSTNVFRRDPFPEEFIIHPQFEAPDSPNRDTAALYGRCLMAAFNQSLPDFTPDFISLDYLKSLVDKPDEKIQAYYVIGSSAPKET